METLAATVRQQGEGEQLWFCGGGLHTWKVTARESGGAFLMFEAEMGEGKLTPLHLHPLADETFYLIEGEILVHLDGTEHTVGAGGVVVMPRGLPHAFKVISPARMLCLHTPGGGEDFYRRASEPVVAGGDPAPIDFDRVRAAAEASDSIEILRPPPF